MIFNKIEIKNIGTYAGQQIIDLKPRVKYGATRPVILIGGKNGAGKTTILESLNICLHGSSSLGAKTKRKDYEKYIINKVHRNGDQREPETNAFISLEFQHAHSGKQDNYFVCRSWKLNTNSIKEQLIVKRNGETLTDLDPNQWNTFLKELIPPGVSQLFFFDGEKIRKLSAESQITNPYFAESIEALLGVDLVNKLSRDLTIYSKRLQLPDAQGSLVNQKIKLENEKGKLKQDLDELRQDRAQIESKIRWLKGKTQTVEAKIASEGGEFFNKYDELKERKAKLDSRKSQVRDTIIEMCHDLFPFSICKGLSTKLVKRLNRETSKIRSKNAKDIIESHISFLKEKLGKELTNQKEKSINRPTISFILKKIDTISEIKFEKLSTSYKETIVHDLSIRDIERLKIWVEKALTEVPTKMKKHGTDLENINNELSQIELNLSRVPSEDLLKPHIEELNQLNHELGSLELKGKHANEKITNAESMLRQLDNQIGKLNQTISDSENIENRAKTIARIQNTLAKFSDELRVSKIRELEKRIETQFNLLSRKKDLISKVKINPKNFEIALYDKHDIEVPKHRLSSGEKQIFAISLLWALRQISGRPTPVIIDTPLSRLDKDHRDKLVDHYFPDASHQTIILSTDTEIDKGYFDSLSKYLSHTYHLNFIQKEGRTIAEAGYFYKAKR